MTTNIEQLLKVNIPPASAKRLEKDRRLVIMAYSLGGGRKEFLIPEGATEVEFLHRDESEEDPELLDGQISYTFYIEYRNVTGTRVEQIKVEPFSKEST